MLSINRAVLALSLLKPLFCSKSSIFFRCYDFFIIVSKYSLLTFIMPYFWPFQIKIDYILFNPVKSINITIIGFWPSNSLRGDEGKSWQYNSIHHADRMVKQVPDSFTWLVPLVDTKTSTGVLIHPDKICRKLFWVKSQQPSSNSQINSRSSKRCQIDQYIIFRVSDAKRLIKRPLFSTTFFSGYLSKKIKLQTQSESY